MSQEIEQKHRLTLQEWAAVENGGFWDRTPEREKALKWAAYGPVPRMDARTDSKLSSIQSTLEDWHEAAGTEAVNVTVSSSHRERAAERAELLLHVISLFSEN